MHTYTHTHTHTHTYIYIYIYIYIRFAIKNLKMASSHFICTFYCDTSPGFLVTKPDILDSPGQLGH